MKFIIEDSDCIPEKGIVFGNAIIVRKDIYDELAIKVAPNDEIQKLVKRCLRDIIKMEFVRKPDQHTDFDTQRILNRARAIELDVKKTVLNMLASTLMFEYDNPYLDRKLKYVAENGSKILWQE